MKTQEKKYIPFKDLEGPQTSPLIAKAIDRTMWDAMNFDLYETLPQRIQEKVDASDYPQQLTMRYVLARNITKVMNETNKNYTHEQAMDQYGAMELPFDINERSSDNEKVPYCTRNTKTVIENYHR